MKCNHLSWTFWIVVGLCESMFAQAHISVGPVGGLQVRHQSHRSALATYGLTAALQVNNRFVLNAEYYTFGNTQRIGSEGSTESLTILEWRTDHRSHVAALGVNYVPAGAPHPPRLLIGLYFGHEWLHSETNDRDLLLGVPREFHLKSNKERILVSPSLGFLSKWHKISVLVGLRYGTALDTSSLSDKDDFGQMRIDVLLDLL